MPSNAASVTTSTLRRRARRLVVTRLPRDTVTRLRLAKWAVSGPPAAISAAMTTKPARRKKRRAPGPRVTPAPTPQAKGRPAAPDGVHPVIHLRRQALFATTSPDGTFLEIGASHLPTLPRRDGFNTKNADHLDRAGLIAKYADQGVDTTAIEDVDFVLTGGNLTETIDGTYDMVLASHVLEHTTSVVHFINECADLLRPDGCLALVVPDMRYCFDRFRERSSLGTVIDAAHSNPRVHSAGTLTEAALYATRRGGYIAWSARFRGQYEWVHSLEEAKELALQADTGTYVDVHRWVFTPHHLRLLLHDLADTGHISLRESHFHDTVGCEFLIFLRPGGAGPGVSRGALVDLADAERRSYDRPRFAMTSTEAPVRQDGPTRD